MDPLIFRDFNKGPATTGLDTFTLLGTANNEALQLFGDAAGDVNIEDNIGVTRFGIVSVRNFDSLTVDSGAGTDSFTYDLNPNNLPTPFIFLQGGASGPIGDSLFYRALPGVTTDLFLGPNPILTSAGDKSVRLNGIEAVTLDINDGSLSVTGTPADDNLVYTPTGAEAGKFQQTGSELVFNFLNLTGTFLVLGGAANDSDSVTIQGTSSRDTFTIDAVARTAQVNTFKPVTLGDTVESLTALGLAGDDTFNVVPAPEVGGGLNNLLINIDGGIPNASDALVVSNAGGATLDADEFVVVNRGRDANSGVVRVYKAAVPFPDITYKNIETVSPKVAGTNVSPNLLLLGPDLYEPNETLGNAAFLGSGANINVQHASIFPNSSENPPTPADQDYYRVVAAQTGILDFQVYFRLYHVALLPQGGVLNVQVLDPLGNVIGMASAGAAGFGALEALSDARVRIPAVAGQTYYVRIFGANPPVTGIDQPPAGSPNASVVNGYDMTILNTPAPQPFNLQLSRSVPGGVAGSPDTGDIPPTAVNSDSGRSQFDDVTHSNLPTIYLRLNDGNLLNDLPGNGTPNAPPAGVIPIPFSPNVNTPGFRVAIFDGNDSQNPVPLGFATQVDPVLFPGLYVFTFTTPLADGVHHINAAVQMVDPTQAHHTGFGAFSLHSLDVTVDTAVPPVFFGSTGSNTDGLDPGSDSGVVGDPATNTDRITNVTRPRLFGVAEANSIIRVYVDIDDDQIQIGQTVAIPLDGTNAFPNGSWHLTSTVDLNDPTLFPRDGVRHLHVTAEDLAGNLSNQAALDIFIDTQGPQITGVEITDHPGFNLFGLKPDNASQGPTPLVNSLTIRLQDLPANDANFLRNAIEAGIAATPGLISVRGDHNGIVAIDSIVVTNDPPIAGEVPTASIELNFKNPLPDDRFTLTVLDTIPDLAGNRLDGENNAIEPVGFPLFPTGDGQPGGSFIARFTVDSRPEIATYAAANVFVDANGNFVSDPQGQDNDFTNRDLTFSLGIVPSLQGIVSPMGIHDGVFAGNFPGLQVRGESATWNGNGGYRAADGFDKLAAYGFDSTPHAFRWLIDTNNDGIIDPAAGDFATIQPGGFQINGLPVAGDFDGHGHNGAEIGLFDGTKWYFDTNHNWVIDGGDLVSPTSLRGVPIVGDFNGDGTIDLATWRDDVFYFNFGSRPAAPAPSRPGAARSTPPSIGACPATPNCRWPPTWIKTASPTSGCSFPAAPASCRATRATGNSSCRTISARTSAEATRSPRSIIRSRPRRWDTICSPSSATISHCRWSAISIRRSACRCRRPKT